MFLIIYEAFNWQVHTELSLAILC